MPLSHNTSKKFTDALVKELGDGCDLGINSVTCIRSPAHARTEVEVDFFSLTFYVDDIDIATAEEHIDRVVARIAAQKIGRGQYARECMALVHELASATKEQRTIMPTFIDKARRITAADAERRLKGGSK